MLSMFDRKFTSCMTRKEVKLSDFWAGGLHLHFTKLSNNTNPIARLAVNMFGNFRKKLSFNCP